MEKEIKNSDEEKQERTLKHFLEALLETVIEFTPWLLIGGLAVYCVCKFKL